MKHLDESNCDSSLSVSVQKVGSRLGELVFKHSDRSQNGIAVELHRGSDILKEFVDLHQHVLVALNRLSNNFLRTSC